MMNFLNKETLIDAASLGGGVIVSKVVKKQIGAKVTNMLPATMSAETKDVLTNLLPIAGGIVTLMVGKGNRIANGLANGMFADAFAGIVDFGLQKAGVVKEPLTGVGEVFMGEVFMGEAGAEDVLMGAAQDMPDLKSDSYDFTSADAGELNY
jgi:hypothetical protein